MPAIRDDFVGAVWVHLPGGSVKLMAGDDVPDGVDVDAELVAEKVVRKRGGARGARASK